MALITSKNNPYQLVDLTDELLIVPNEYGLIQDLGLFQSQGVIGSNFYVDEHEQYTGLLVDLPRGTKPAAGREDKRRRRWFEIPHFPLIESIRPSDIARVSSNGDGMADALSTKRAEKMMFIRRTLANTLEVARCQMLSSGTLYAPNGNVVLNVYSDFGVVRKDIDFAFGTTTTETLNKGEEAIAHTQDNLKNGGAYQGLIAICSPTFFSRLTTHNSVRAAFTMYQSQQEPFRLRLGGSNAQHRRFEYGGVTYIEYRTSAASPLIPDGECRFVPTGTDFFKTYFGSADKFETVNQMGQEAYYFEKMAETDDEWTILAETNFANICLNPALMIRGYSSN